MSAADATTDTAAAIADRFLRVVSDGDTDAFLNLFADAGTVDDWGRKFIGSKRIRAWSDEEFIGAGGHLHDVTVKATAGTATVVGQWTSQRHNGPSRFVLETGGGRLLTMTISEA